MFSMLAIIRGLRRAANIQCSLPGYRLDLWLEIMSLPMKGVRVFSLSLSLFLSKDKRAINRFPAAMFACGAVQDPKISKHAIFRL